MRKLIAVLAIAAALGLLGAAIASSPPAQADVGNQIVFSIENVSTSHVEADLVAFSRVLDAGSLFGEELHATEIEEAPKTGLRRAPELHVDRDNGPAATAEDTWRTDTAGQASLPPPRAVTS